MKKGKLSMICLFSFLIFFESALISEASVPDAVLKQKEAVVTLLIYENDNLIAYGSGFITDPDGIIATNYHVISALSKNPDASIAIRLENGKFVKAQKILSLDKTNDVVLIKVEGKGLPSLKLYNDYKPRQGEDVFVIGSPFGFETTITNGIISSIRGTDEFLQITAPISPGSSGSPVFNANGDIIGIATLIMQGGQNLNFAIPVKYITKMDKDLQITKTEPLKSTIPSSVVKPKNESQARNYEEHLRLAREYVKKEQRNDAVDEYAKAIHIKPDNAYLYFGRGEASEDLKSSLSDYSKAIALQPDAAFYFYRANIYKIKKEYGNTITDLNKAITLMPDTYFLYYERGKAYHKLKLYKMAIGDYTSAINLKPDRHKYYLIKYAPFEELGYSQEVLNEVMKDFSSDYPLSSFYSHRADSYKENLQLNEAIKDFTKAIVLVSKEQDQVLNAAWYYLDRGRIYEKTDQKHKALEDFQKACDLTKTESFWIEDPGKDPKNEKGEVQKKKISSPFCHELREFQNKIARGTKWVFIAKNNNKFYYYDKTSIRQQPNKNKRVWIRIEVKVNDVNLYFEEVKDIGEPVTGYENFSHQVSLFEVDCNGKASGNVSFVTYDDKGNILHSYYKKTIEMTPIVPDSIGESFYKVVCEGKRN